MDEEIFEQICVVIFLGIIFLSIIFFVLKLTGSITWAWIWVLCPLWGFTVLAFIIFIISIIACFKLKDL